MPSALEAARVSAASLPLIDVSGLSSKNAAERQAVGAQLARQFPQADIGIFRVLCQIGRGDL